jgi:two-component system nitrogen regulation sensor histidine kinase NtrY
LGSAGQHYIAVWRNTRLVKIRFFQKILFLSLLSGGAGSVVALILLWTEDFGIHVCAILSLVILVSWFGFALAVRSKLAFSLRTISNLVGAIRENDFSLRIRGADRNDAMGELIMEVNALAHSLQKRRFGALEATTLLRKIMAEIDIALFGFSPEGKLRLINESGQALLCKSEEELLGCSSISLGLADCLVGSSPRVIDLPLPSGTRCWELRRTTYREKGQSHQLLFLSDITRTLHEQERLAWKRLIQILRHEINNSLTPIQSVAQSLQTYLKNGSSREAWEDDLREGLEIIAERSEILGKFIASYSQLTRLPDPAFATMNVREWIQHVANLKQRMPVEICSGPDITIQADRSQLDQLLINLISNAVESSLEANPNKGGQVSTGWDADQNVLRVWIDDDGTGIKTDQDPFVPFFTTKPEGSGIGLALSRQIAEAHGGNLTLENHPDRPGCRAVLCLPLRQ